MALQGFDELFFGDFAEFELQENACVLRMYLGGFQVTEAEPTECVDGASYVDVEQHTSEVEDNVADAGGYGGFKLHGDRFVSVICRRVVRNLDFRS